MNEKTFHTFVKGEKIPILVYNDKNTFSPASVIIFIITTRPKYTSTKQIIPISYLTRCVQSTLHSFHPVKKVVTLIISYTQIHIVHPVFIFVQFHPMNIIKGWLMKLFAF